jgi:hypothetical protein
MAGEGQGDDEALDGVLMVEAVAVQEMRWLARKM